MRAMKKTRINSVALRSRLRAAVAAAAATSLMVAAMVGMDLAAASPAHAAAGDPFDLSRPTVFVAQSPQDGTTGLLRAETSGNGTYAFSTEGPSWSGRYNAVGMNLRDGFMYGSTTQEGDGIPTRAVVRVGQDGVVTRVGGETFPIVQWVGGMDDDTGFLYTTNGSVTDSTRGRTIFRVNTSMGAITEVGTFPQGSVFADWTYSEGNFWALDSNEAGTVVRYNPASGAMTRYPGALPGIRGGSYGAAWKYGNGNLGFSQNGSGTILQVKVTNPNAATPGFELVASVAGPSSSLNDGTSTPGLPADLSVTKTGPATFTSGGRIAYDVTVRNNGAGASSGWVVTDALPAGLSNPTVTGNVTTSVSGSTLTVNGGRLEVGQSTTFRIQADTDVSPPACIVNTASVLGNEEDPNASNNESSARSCALALSVDKTSNATRDSRPGDTVTYTVTAKNVGAGDYTAENPAVVFDDLTGVLDDADYNGDAAASAPGTLRYAQPRISWSGPLAVGASTTITYSVTLKAGGDGAVKNVAWVPNDPSTPTPPTCTPATGGIDNATGQPCAVEEYPLPRLTIEKTVDRTELPAVGERATFTIVVRNDGPGDYSASAPATATDDMSDVLDDATFDDASLGSDTGTVTRNGNTLSWSGALAAGTQATITYSVTYTGNGNQILRNRACVPTDETAPGAESCDSVRVPGALLTQQKSAEASSDPVVEGSTITYTLSFRNEGQAAAAVNAVDDLTRVLDDADVTTEPTASEGLRASRDGARISIVGSVPVGQTLTVTYTVTVRPNGDRGDSIASNFLLRPGQTPPADGVCEPTEAEPPSCTTTPITGISYAKSVQASETPARAGTELTYTIVARNEGATPVDVLRDDNVRDVLDDATLTGAPQSDTESVTVEGPSNDVLAIRGTLAIGAEARITYTVTVKGSADRGDSVSRNFLVPPGTPPSDTCDPVTEQCTVTPIQGYTVAKASSAETTTPGAQVTYTITVANTGAVEYTDEAPASFEDDLSGVLDDATYNNDVTSGAEISDRTLSWSGPLAVGEVVTITYSVTVNQPMSGDGLLRNAVVPDGPGGECDPAGECATETPVASYRVVKSASTQRAAVGDRVTYTITVTNIGQVDYTEARPAAFTDDLSSALARGDYNGDASAGTRYERPVLSWSGSVGIGESVDVTYSVTLRSVGEIRNVVVTPEGSGANCPEGSADTDCAATTIIVPPDLAVTGGAGWVAGGFTGIVLLGLGALMVMSRRRHTGSADHADV